MAEKTKAKPKKEKTEAGTGKKTSKAKVSKAVASAGTLQAEPIAEALDAPETPAQMSVEQDIDRGELGFTIPEGAGEGDQFESGSADTTAYDTFGFNTGTSVQYDLSQESASGSPLTASAIEQGQFESGGAVTAVQANVPGEVPAPTMEWHASPNHFSGRNGQKVVAVCNHIIAGTLGSADNWFQNSSSEASTHFGIGKNGRIIQWVSTSDAAWGNGRLNKPDTTVPWVTKAQREGINPNNLTVSIEHEGQTGEPFTEQMYHSTLALHKYLISKFNIPIDRHHIVGHYQLDSVERPFCPGSGLPWDRLIGDLKTFFGQEGVNVSAVTVVPVNYTAKLKSAATVRTGPGRSFQVVSNLAFDPNHSLTVTGETHGEAIPTKSQASGNDDVWSFIPALNGFVTRTALSIG